MSNIEQIRHIIADHCFGPHATRAHEERALDIASACTDDMLDQGLVSVVTAEEPATISPYPEHEKMAEHRVELDAAGSFYDWLQSQNYHIGVYDEYDRSRPLGKSIQDLLAGWLDIDQSVIEAEKRAMLDTLRARNASMS